MKLRRKRERKREQNGIETTARTWQGRGQIEVRDIEMRDIEMQRYRNAEKGSSVGEIAPGLLSCNTD